MNAAACPDPNTLSSFAHGHLSDDKLQEIAEHLDTCSACRSTVEEFSGAGDPLLVAVRGKSMEDEFSQEAEYQDALALVRDYGRDQSSSDTSDNSATRQSAAAEELGTIRDYELLETLGEGGMGAVYKARHTKLDKVVALKILPADRLQNEAAIARFEREMKAVGKLEHPNIVAARDAGEADGTHYLVMELVNGIDLSALFRKVGPATSSVGWTSKSDQDEADGLGSPSYSGAMTIPDACEMIRQAALGLQEAYEDGMVHRDIKPSNLMLARSRKGRKPPIVKILDLGLALLDDHRGEQRDLTSTGHVMGTLDYMAPEQGMDSHEVDIRADIYSLGATLYKLLTGEAPFSSHKYNTLVKMMMALATEQAPSLATLRDDLPAELAAIVDRMLARNPDDRFAEPEEVAEALKPFCKGCDLALLLKSATAKGAETAEDESKVATHESLKSSSVETAPTMDAPVGSPLPVGDAQGQGFVRGPQPDPTAQTATMPIPLPSGDLAKTAAEQHVLGEGLLTSPKPSTEGLPDAEPAAGRPAVSEVARSGDLATADGLATTTATTAKYQPHGVSGRLRKPWANAQRLIGNRRNQVLIATGLAGIILLSAIIFYIKTNHGTIVVEIDDPSISVTVQGEDIQITKNDSGEAYKIKPGEHTLHVKHGDLEFDTDRFKLRRGEEVVLSVRIVEGEVQVVQKDEKQTVIGGGLLKGDEPTQSASFALAFDGNSTYVEIPTLKYDGSHPITIEATVLASSLSADYGHIAGNHTMDRSPVVSASAALFYSPRRAWGFMRISDGTMFSPVGGSVIARQLVRLAGVSDSESTKLFIDGKQVAKLGQGQEYPQGEDAHSFIIGAGQSGALRGFHFHGIIDEVRISSIARYDKDFTPAERFEPDEHTLALYHFDEGQGDIAYDSSPNKHHGKIVGAKWVKQDKDGLPVDDPNDLAAAWVLGKGGKVTVSDGTRKTEIDSADELAKYRFLLLTAVDLNDCGIRDEDLDNLRLKGLTHLSSLSLANCPITDAGLEKLAVVESLRGLQLDGTQVTDSGLRHVAKLSNLSQLELRRTGISDGGLRWWSVDNKLQSLALSETKISEQALRSLRDYAGLRQLELYKIQLSPDAIAAVQVALRDCKVLVDIPPEQLEPAVAKQQRLLEGAAAPTAKVEERPLIAHGKALNTLALVSQPTKIEGLRSWTIETRGHRRVHWWLHYSPQGDRLATSGGFGALRIWNAGSRTLERLIGCPGYVRDFAWSPDGMHVAVDVQDGLADIHIYEAASGLLERRIEFPRKVGEESSFIGSMHWSPDGNLLAVPAPVERSVYVVDAFTGELCATLDHVSPVTEVRWSPDGSLLATTAQANAKGWDDKVRIWEADSWKLRNVFDCEERSESGWSLRWSPEGSRVAAAGTSPPNSLLRVWNIESGKLRKAIVDQKSAYLAWHPKNHFIAVGREGITLVDPASLASIRELAGSGGEGRFDWSPDGRELAACGRDGTLIFWRPNNPEPLATIAASTTDVYGRLFPRWTKDFSRIAPTGPIASWSSGFAVSQDEGRVAQGDRPGSSKVWVTSKDSKKGNRILIDGFNGSMALSPDGRFLIAACGRESVAIWDLEERRIARELTGDGNIQRVAWSPSDNVIATAVDNPRKVTLWDGKSLERLRDIPAYGYDGLAFSPDGKKLALGGNETQVWDVASVRRIGQFPKTASGWRPFVWLDDAMLAIACEDGRLRVVNTDNGQVIRTVEDVVSRESAFSSDGRQFVYQLGRSAVRAIDTASGDELGTMLYLGGNGWLAINPDGHVRGSEGIEEMIVYVALTETGEQLTLSPAEFADKYGWKNDPEKVKLAE